MRIRFIRARETWPLRHRVLRPHQELEDCDFPNDRNPDSFHLGAFEQDELVGIASFYAERNEQVKGWKQYRLRGMAVAPELQGRGIGRKLVLVALDHLEARHADSLWCNARTRAAEFYGTLGFTSIGEPFDIPGIGEHYVMSRQVLLPAPPAGG